MDKFRTYFLKFKISKTLGKQPDSYPSPKSKIGLPNLRSAAFGDEVVVVH